MRGKDAKKKHVHPKGKRKKGGVAKNRLSRFSFLPFRPSLPARPIRRARGFWSRRFLMTIRGGGLRSVIATTQSQPMRLAKKVAARRGLIFPFLGRRRLAVGFLEIRHGPTSPTRVGVRWRHIQLFRAVGRQLRRFPASLIVLR